VSRMKLSNRYSKSMPSIVPGEAIQPAREPEIKDADQKSRKR
jgi:hypothetical protein